MAITRIQSNTTYLSVDGYECRRIRSDGRNDGSELERPPSGYPTWSVPDVSIAANPGISVNIGYCEGCGWLTNWRSCPGLEAWSVRVCSMVSGCHFRMPDWGIDGNSWDHNGHQVATLQCCQRPTPSPVSRDENHAANERAKRRECRRTGSGGAHRRHKDSMCFWSSQWCIVPSSFEGV